jgi:hypothetical protein
MRFRGFWIGFQRGVNLTPRIRKPVQARECYGVVDADIGVVRFEVPCDRNAPGFRDCFLMGKAER